MLPHSIEYSRATMLRLVNTDPILTKVYLDRSYQLSPHGFDASVVNKVLNDMFTDFVLTPVFNTNDNGEEEESPSGYVQRYLDQLEPVERKLIPLTDPTPEVVEIQRIINRKGWKRFMNQLADYSKYMQALMNNVGLDGQQVRWEQIEKECRKLARHHVTT